MSETISVTMTREAAERFRSALLYADGVCSNMADANDAPATKAKIEEHADWLRWGLSRVHLAEREVS
jgi:hypothetical protein